MSSSHEGGAPAAAAGAPLSPATAAGGVAAPLREAALVGVVLAALLAGQALPLPNLVTGCLVNAVFVATLGLGGLRAGLLLALLSPLGAAVTGHLPPPLLPLLPAIVAGNAVLVGLCHLLAGARRGLRLAVAATAKALVIAAGGWAVLAWWPAAAAVRPLLLGILTIQAVTAAVGIVLGEMLATRLQPAAGGPVRPPPSGAAASG